MKIKDQKPIHNMKAETTKLDGVIIGVLVAINKNNKPLVVFPSNVEETGIIAKSTTTLEKKDIGCEVALLFEGGDVRKPLVIGRIQHPEDTSFCEIEKPVEVELDDEHLVLKADHGHSPSWILYRVLSL